MMRILIFALLALGVGCVWGIGWLFGAALVVRILLTLILLCLAVTVLLVLHVHRIRSASRLERGILKQAETQADAARHDRRAAILAAQKRAQQAIAALKATRAGRAGLYTLPWYVLVGPPGVGKTTAIRHSGLNFLEKSGVASRFRGVGGTKDCDWWFTDNAILLDTAGRFTSSGGDDAEWFAFLDLVRTYRPRTPINGVILTLSLEDLLRARDEELAQLMARLRARMDELCTRLKTRVPVYVLFTKLDMVAGFTEFWSDLSPKERGQVWGATFPLTQEGELRTFFEREIDLLGQVLRSRLVRRLARETQVSARRTLWTFPVEFARLRTLCGVIVGELSRSNAYQETPLLRGAYFTSGTQEAAAASQVLASMAGAIGLKLPPRVAAKAEPKSYFLTELFGHVVFPDRNIATRTQSAARRDLALRGGLAALACAGSTTLLLPGCASWSRNRDLAASTAAVALAVEASPGRQSPGDRVAALGAAKDTLRELDQWNERGAPWRLRWGMYSGEPLRIVLRDVYTASLGALVLAPVQEELEARLRLLDGSPVRSRESFGRDFDTLKLYRMLGEPGHLDAAWAAPRVVRVWSDAAHLAKSNEADLLPHVRYLLELEARGETQPRALDATLAERARSLLAEVPQVDRLYESLVRDADTEIAPIRRETIFYGAIAPFIQSRRGVKVTGAYTKQGWLRIRALLGEERSKLAAESWVLGDTSDGTAEDAADKLRELYFERYRAAWRDFLADLQVQDPGNAEIALEELNALSEPEWPYLRLLRVLSDNVALDVEDPGALQKVIDTGKQVLDGGALALPARSVSSIEVSFAPMTRFGVSSEARAGDTSPPTGLSQYEALLAKIDGTLTNLRDSDTGSDPRQMSAIFQEALQAATILLAGQSDFTRPLLGPLLMNPITLAWNRVLHDAGAAASASWETAVWQKWHDKLEGRYPFAESTTEASLADFVDFFAPADGALWSFYDESLRPTLDRTGTSFTAARRFKSAIGYTPEFLDKCLHRGAQITSVIFPPKGDHPGVEFDVNLHSVAASIGEVTIEIDGVAHVYRNEPEQWVTVVWPGTKSHGARLQVRGAGALNEEINHQGDFGLFRLLDGADLRPGNAGGRTGGDPTLVATWALSAARGAMVSLDLRPHRADNPLSPGYFEDYACPRAITSR